MQLHGAGGNRSIPQRRQGIRGSRVAFFFKMPNALWHRYCHAQGFYMSQEHIKVINTHIQN